MVLNTYAVLFRGCKIMMCFKDLIGLTVDAYAFTVFRTWEKSYDIRQ